MCEVFLHIQAAIGIGILLFESEDFFLLFSLIAGALRWLTPTKNMSHIY
jgi:hypothetical protein